MNQLFAAYSRVRTPAIFRIILGEEALSELDLIYADFSVAFEEQYISQGFETDRSIEETLSTGWKLLSMLRNELKRVHEEYIEQYYEICDEGGRCLMAVMRVNPNRMSCSG